MAPDEAILDEAGGLRWVNAPACPVCGGAERRPFDRFVVDMGIPRTFRGHSGLPGTQANGAPLAEVRQ